MKMRKFFQEMSLEIIHMGHRILGKEWLYRNFSKNYSKIYFITRGEGIVRYPDRKIILEPGKLYLIPPFKPADYFTTEDPMEQYFIHFYAKFNNNIGIFSLMDFYDAVSLDNPELISCLFERLNQIYAKPTDFLMVEADSILRYLLSLLRKESTENIENMIKRIKPFEPVLDYLEKNYSKKITINQMAEMVHLQPTYFSTAFKKVFGLAPVEFVISKKLEKAQELLFFTNSSVKEIAFKVGFNDEFYFSRIFKKYLGISPAKYRIRRKI
jgi:AraC-like DNA-binding protein